MFVLFTTQTGLGKCRIQGMVVKSDWSPWRDSPFARGHSPHPRLTTLYRPDPEKCPEIQGLNQMTFLGPSQLKYFMMTD